ncbi:DUF3223 domain-containing protein [Porticoccus sp.]|uniref:DUF3223 domain-containing protein n=1 Tax=Porticoccus sp. TaxID=2024853 RepID=UPI003F697A56
MWAGQVNVTKCFWVERTDGTKERFLYKNCVTVSKSSLSVSFICPLLAGNGHYQTNSLSS